MDGSSKDLPAAGAESSPPHRRFRARRLDGGTNTKLMAADGVYCHLYKLQAGRYRIADVAMH